MNLKSALFFGLYSATLIVSSAAVTFISLNHADPAVAEDESIKGPVAFYPIRPLFLINFPSEGRLRNFQVQIDIMTQDDEDALQALQKYEPLIKSEILDLLSQTSVNNIMDETGKVALRQKMYHSIKKSIKKHTGEDYVKQVLFTAFIVE